MMSRARRVIALITVAGVAAPVLMAVAGVSPAGAVLGTRSDRGLLDRCAKVALGVQRGSAKAVAGSANPHVISQLAIFRRARTSADALPKAKRLPETLLAAGARTYDPAASVLVTSAGAPVAVYAVPATVSRVAFPSGCRKLPQFAGFSALIAERAQQMGSGPGVCLVATESRHGAANVVCQSDAVLSGYVGATGISPSGSGKRLALIPDGVSAVTYRLADGRQFKVPVASNLATLPAALSLSSRPGETVAALRRALSAALPTKVTESGPGPAPVAVLNRPTSLIPNVIRTVSFLRKLIACVGTHSSSSSTVSCHGAGLAGRLLDHRWGSAQGA